MMEHYLFVVLFTIPLLVILLIERKQFKKYLSLGITVMVAAFILENTTTYLGFWHHLSTPHIPYVSVWTLILYLHYISFCYYFGNRVSKR